MCMRRPKNNLHTIFIGLIFAWIDFTLKATLLLHESLSCTHTEERTSQRQRRRCHSRAKLADCCVGVDESPSHFHQHGQRRRTPQNWASLICASAGLLSVYEQSISVWGMQAEKTCSSSRQDSPPPNSQFVRASRPHTEHRCIHVQGRSPLGPAPSASEWQVIDIDVDSSSELSIVVSQAEERIPLKSTQTLPHFATWKKVATSHSKKKRNNRRFI